MLVVLGKGGPDTFDGDDGGSEHVLAWNPCTEGIEMSNRDEYKLGVACLGICFVDNVSLARQEPIG